MACHRTIIDTQTEFEFFNQLVTYPSLADCGGPLVPLGFTDPALGRLIHVLNHLSVPDNYLDNFQTQMLDSGIFVIVMCSKHWVAHSQSVAILGNKENIDSWIQLSEYIFMLMCKLNSWDHKEIANYIASVLNIQKRNHSD